jgi:hypothetical protein
MTLPLPTAMQGSLLLISLQYGDNESSKPGIVPCTQAADVVW